MRASMEPVWKQSLRRVMREAESFQPSQEFRPSSRWLMEHVAAAVDSLTSPDAVLRDDASWASFKAQLITVKDRCRWILGTGKMPHLFAHLTDALQYSIDAWDYRIGAGRRTEHLVRLLVDLGHRLWSVPGEELIQHLGPGGHQCMLNIARILRETTVHLTEVEDEGP